MATAGAAQAVDRPKTDPRQKQADLSLSSRADEPIPNLLQIAPFIVNHLAQLRLIVYSDDGLRIQNGLAKRGIQMRAGSLPQAVEVLGDQVDDAFECATKNMREIQRKAKFLFDKKGHAGAILECLNNPKSDQRRMTTALIAMQSGMQQCADWAAEIEKKFAESQEIGRSIKYSLGGESASYQDEQDQATKDRLRAEAQKLVQDKIEREFKDAVQRALKDTEKAERQFDKQLKRSEFRDVGLKAAYDLECGLSGIINASINLVGNVPKIAMLATQAAGQIAGTPMRMLGTMRMNASDDDAASPATQQQVSSFDAGIEPALLYAQRIAHCIDEVKTWVSQGLLEHLKGSSSDLEQYKEQLQLLLENVSRSKSESTMQARQCINAAVAVIEDIEKRRGSVQSWAEGQLEWSKLKANWVARIQRAHADALSLMAFSQSRPGQGFGTMLDRPSGFDSLLKRRHEKLLITRAGVDAARTRLDSATERRLEAHRNAVQLSADIQQLTSKQAQLGDIKKALKMAIDHLQGFQREIQRMVRFFAWISSQIDAVGRELVQRHIDDCKSGVPRSESSVRILRESLVDWRSHVITVIDQAALYEGIATKYILPMIDSAACIKIGDTLEEQEESKTKLEQLAHKCAEEIGHLAEEESKKIRDALDARETAVNSDLISSESLLQDYEKNAIEAGVKRQEKADIPLTAKCDTESGADSGTMDFADY